MYTANNPNCCTGTFSTPDQCPPSGVQDYDYFSACPRSHSLEANSDTLRFILSESQCPNAYAYAYDESSGTALWKCDSGLNADYTITFCP